MIGLINGHRPDCPRYCAILHCPCGKPALHGLRYCCEEHQPRSIGGIMPISRRCWGGEHDQCLGTWTQYPELAGPCECLCHRRGQ